jgi:RsiW-degrading membrane proteinase PrsW (M82 family)
MGRAVLTTMVHVLSTGVLGYFFGLAFFASPLLKDRFHAGKLQPVSRIFGLMFGMHTEAVFAFTQMTIGIVAAITLHGLFDFVVSLPDVLPGNPTTVGALLNLPAASILQSISITLLPSVLYVVGGFWILTALFERAEDMKEYGLIIPTQTVVTG